MGIEYLRDLERDTVLNEAVGPVLPALRRLNVDQIETLIFFLKSLHAYYPDSENDVAHYGVFSTKLDAIRNSPSQQALQRRAATQLFKAMLVGVGAGIALIVGVLVWLGGNGFGGGAIIASAVGLWALAEARYGKPALVTAKEQDRRYFLESIRAAKACNELDWAGLFSHNGVAKDGPQSDEDIRLTNLRVAELSAALRAALYNDEFRQYSQPSGLRK